MRAGKVWKAPAAATPREREKSERGRPAAVADGRLSCSLMFLCSERWEDLTAISERTFIWDGATSLGRALHKHSSDLNEVVRRGLLFFFPSLLLLLLFPPPSSRFQRIDPSPTLKTRTRSDNIIIQAAERRPSPGAFLSSSRTVSLCFYYVSDSASLEGRRQRRFTLFDTM